MPNISLASSQYNAPGVYLSQNTNGNVSSSVESFTAAYIFGEILESVSTSLTTGIPYNVPLLITSLEDFEIRLGNGSISDFLAPKSGPALITYNSIKQFFRNAASIVGASLYFIRVKPVDSYDIVVGNNADQFIITDELGLQQTIYGYPIEINGVQLGRVDYDNEGNATHIGVVVSSTSDRFENTKVIKEAIRSSSLNQSVLISNNESFAENVITLYSREASNPLIINGINTSTLSGYGYDEAVSFDSFTLFKSPVNTYNSNYASIVEARHYVYSIETAIDPSVFPAGFLMAPSAFAKFNPEDRLIVGTALENKASEIDFSWMAIVDCGPQDGSEIAKHYAYEKLNFGDFTSLNNSDFTDGERPLYVAETQEFFLLVNENSYSLPDSDCLLEPKDIYLNSNFVPSLPSTPSGTLIKAGSVITIQNTNILYVVNEDFTPNNSNISILDPIGNGTMKSGLLTPVTMARKLLYQTDMTIAVAGQALNAGSYIRGNQITGGNALSTDYYRVQSTFTPSVLPINPANPRGTGTPEPSLLSSGNHWVPKGSLFTDNGTVYYVRKAFNAQYLGSLPNINDAALDRDIPLAYYKLWVQENLKDGNIKTATFNPSDIESVKLGARNVLYNCATHEALQREHLMYTSPLGHLAYYAPYLVDLEGYNVPPSSAVIGTALRSYRDRGFFEPIGGVQYPLKGVLRPQISLTRAHQQQSNPTGMNAIRLLPNQGTVIYGARTRSANKLFKWVNTRIIVNVVINSLRNAFDDKIFRAITSGGELFREIRSTAEGLLYRLWTGGALYGSVPSDSYKVICNDSNNPDYDIEEGVINCNIFIVPVSTLEVLNITITRTAVGSLSATVSSTTN